MYIYIYLYIYILSNVNEFKIVVTEMIQIIFTLN
jgi:hypothetical protein